MRRSWRAPLVLVAALVLLGTVHGAVGTARAAHGPPSPLEFMVVSPKPNSTVYTNTPTIEVSFSDSVSTLNPATVSVFVDGLNETASGSVVVGSNTVTYPISVLLKLAVGLNNASVTAFDMAHHEGRISWNFTVSAAPPPSNNPLAGVKPTTVLLYIGIGAALTGAGVGGYILFLKQTTRFTFRRYFATHPVRRTYLVVYLPLLVAFMALLFGLSYVASTPGLPPNAVDYVFIVVTFIALTPLGIDARQEMMRIRAYERAFAQLLFEMADAMRGGIDPAKALVELSKTHTNILAKHLRIAADAIRLGRPFEAILREMVASMQSRLITRYAGLIADASQIGGETATVVYRAAKDMDDFVKIEEEREKQLMLPVAVIYIAFAVLMAVLFALLYIAPTLGTLNVSILGVGTPLAGGGSAPTQIPKLGFTTLKERFFELMTINALGTGAIIGAFTEGRARYGILHSLALVAATVAAFLILFPG
ncbi:MAG TPA: type II secretion system F family protein [Thermoplasmata archaeon]|nr:type II secretion system F family protein [Thermoplasmata archaeon]